MMTKHDNYTVYDYDNLEHGSNLKIDHTVYFDGDPDISDLTSKSIEKIQAMRDKSVSREDAAYEKLRQAVKQWEKEAAITRRYDRAIEYLKIPEAEHTSNEWVKGNSSLDYTSRSNRVYKMSCRIYERSSWRTDSKKYEVTWFIYTNSPKDNGNTQLAGQERTFNTKEDAEKYLSGRIKAYEHLFTEITPPVPDNLIRNFSLYVQILPGYITESMLKEQSAEKAENPLPEKKPSIRKQLAELKQQKNNTSKQEPQKKRSEPEIS